MRLFNYQIYLLIFPARLLHSAQSLASNQKETLFEFSVDKQHLKHLIYDKSLFILMFPS